MSAVAALEAMSEAVLAVAGELSVEPVLRKLVGAARRLVNARYAAIGVPDEGGGFATFLTSGLTEAEIDAIGPLPRRHGLLGAMFDETTSYRTSDITTDPRFWGWPNAHPDMQSFLGVPIVAKGDVVGLFYLTDKQGADEFSADDQHLIELLAAHAAVALDNARLFERSREVTVLEERERLARELHDAMTQTLFSLALTAESAAALVERDPRAAAAQLRDVTRLAREVMGELRALVDGLQPARLETDGLAAAARQQADLLQRAHPVDLRFEVTGERRLRPTVEAEVFRILQEALHNALRHAHADHILIRLDLRPPGIRLEVADDGVGFDPESPALRARRLGLSSMRERAREVGGQLAIDTRPGRGTTVALEVPDA